MKSVFFLLFSTGLATSQLLFTPGNEYVYTYSGKMLSGIPQIDSTFAGLSLSGQVIVQATGTHSFKLAMRDVGFSTFNDKLTGSEPVSWRNVVTPATTPVTDLYKQYMESPVEFMMVKGEVTTVKISSQEPQWSVNFKKALVAVLKVQLPVHTQVVPYFWTVMEQGIEGKCENTYQVSELPEYLVWEYEHGMVKTELCKGKKFYQVTKTRDTTKCMERSIFLASKTHKKCLMGNCNGMNTKTSTTRYLGCGETLETLQLHGMINEGELQQNVLAFNTEPVVTGTKQVLKLVTIKPVSTVIPQIVAPKTLTDLLYVFPKTVSNLIKSNEEQKQHYQQSTLEPSSQVFLPEGSLESMSIGEIKTKLIAKLVTIATQLTEVEHFGKKEVTSQIKSLKTVISILTTEDIKSVFTSLMSQSIPVQTKTTVRSILFETIKMAGTSPSVMFFKEMIETEQLTEMESFMVIGTLAHYIRTPTVELIDQIFELIKSPAVTSNPMLKSHANVVFATIVRKACLTTPVNEVYPEYVFGQMCSPDNLKISQVYIPYLVRELKTVPVSEKQSAIVALGALGHESVIPLLLTYIEGKAEGCTPAVRKMGIYALAEVTKKYRNILLPVYDSLVHNLAEERGIRIAAFVMMLRMEPSTVYLQKLAVSTWFEQDAEMHKFVYSTLKSLSQITEHPEGSITEDLTKKALTVLPLAKPVPGIISSSFYSFITGYLKNLQVGAEESNAMITEIRSQTFYHKTEYFLKQVQTIPMEFAVHVGGVKALVSKLASSVTGETANYLEKIHPEWRQIIQNLEISAQEEAQFEAGFWTKFSDDIQFVYEANFKTVEFIKEKIEESIKAPGKFLEKVCGKKQININHVFEELPYQALVPSDLGFPIVIETQGTYLVSLIGELDIMCSNSIPAVGLNLAKKAAFTNMGYVGTVSPFTNELVVAGINVHRASNIPINTVLEIVPSSSTMKITMKQMTATNPRTNTIDMLHYHVKPFTAMKPVVFKDLTPIVLHKNTKVLKSKASLKTFESKFGQTLGLDMNFKIDTECDLYDMKTMMDSWSNYKYNPYIAGWFHFTETALKFDGMPTARFHKYTLVHNPSMSSTKEAEISIMLTLASKLKDQQPQLVKLIQSSIQTIELPSISTHEKCLHECITKLESESSYAANVLVTAKLIGGLPKTYSYSITAGKGSSSLAHKWNLNIEMENGVSSMKKMCVEGAIKYPIVPTSEIKFKYYNHIGFGQTCDEYFVNAEGTTSVTDKQKQYSRISSESKQCEKLTIESQKLSQLIKSQSQEQEKSILQRKYSQVSYKQHKACLAKKEQAATLDQVNVEITTSETLPPFVYTFGKMVNTGLKSLLFQYISAVPRYIETSKVQVKLNFNQKLNTMTMYVQSPMDTMVYKNIRLPSEVQNLLPVVATMNPVESSYKALTGSPLYAQCVIGQGYVQTFDKKTYGYQIDQCEHVVTSDCSKEYNYAVVAKEVYGLKHITVYHGLNKIALKPSESYSSSGSSFKLEVNGEEISLIKNSIVSLKSLDLSSSLSALWSLDNVLVLDTNHARVTYNGKLAIIEEKSMLADGSNCGLCGDYNKAQLADVKSPKGCIYQSPRTAALSYRVKNAQCTLTQQQQQQIQAEEKQCVKVNVKMTQLSSLYQSKIKNNYSIKKHSYIYQSDKICISQLPVMQCISGSIPSATTKKSIKFVCLPESRLSKLYAERIDRGESPQELKHQPVSFEAKMEQPISCGPSQI